MADTSGTKRTAHDRTETAKDAAGAAGAKDTAGVAGAKDAAGESQRQLVREAAQRFEEVSRKIAETLPDTAEPVQRPEGADTLNDLLEQEAERFSAVAGRVAALSGEILEAAKAGNDRIAQSNARLEAAFAAFENRG